MGLDIFLYRIKKPKNMKPGKMYDDQVISSKYDYLKVTEIGENVLKTIRNNSTPITLRIHIWDAKKIAEKIGVSGAESVSITGIWNNILNI